MWMWRGVVTTHYTTISVIMGKKTLVVRVNEDDDTKACEGVTITTMITKTTRRSTIMSVEVLSFSQRQHNDIVTIINIVQYHMRGAQTATHASYVMHVPSLPPSLPTTEHLLTTPHHATPCTTINNTIPSISSLHQNHLTHFQSSQSGRMSE